MRRVARKIRTLRADFSGVINAKLRAVRLRAWVGISTLLSRVLCWGKGVQVGKKVAFYGIPVMVRTPGSRIEIGDHATFRSDFASNLVGLNRRCILATHGEGAVISVGEGSGLSGTVLGARTRISIGKNVLCGANVLITDWDWHNVSPEMRHDSSHIESRPVTIEDNVWLGLNATVLKGVTIGKNSVIGANSLVTKDVPANVVAAGNPCRVIRSFI